MARTITTDISLRDARVTGRRRMTPDDAGVLRLASNIGYGLPESLADLIDNSIDAGAGKVLIRVYQEGDRLTRLAVVDDGAGMDRDSLREAMRLGRTDKGIGELGTYGIGLKAASLSHTETLTVVSRRDSDTSAVRYTTRSIREGWKLDELDQDAAAAVMDQVWSPGFTTDRSGTVVMWDDMPTFAAAEGSPARRFGQLVRRLSLHLGLHFGRFLGRGLSLSIDLFDESSRSAGFPRTVERLDPFPARSGHRGYPVTFHAEFGQATELGLKAFIWPPNSRESGYNLDGRASQRQGFYFYRNDRLIQAGGWNGWRNNDAEPHHSLARVLIDLPARADLAFGLNAQKNGIVVPPDFVEGVSAARAGETSMTDYIRIADEVYRSADRPPQSGRPVPSSGLSKRLRRELKLTLAGDDATAADVGIRWAPLPEGLVFDIDPDSDEIVLNQQFRRKLLGGRRPSRNDAPVIKTLIFLLTAEDVLRRRRSRQVLEKQEAINQCLLAALQDD